jgi:hypothetical protein
VQHAALVRVVDGLQERREDAEARREREARGRGGIARAELRDDALEGLAFDVLHDEVVLARVVDADVVHGHDPRVLELADRADFLGETQDRSLVVRAARLHALHGHAAPDVAVAHEHDLAHGAFAERAHDLVALLARGLVGHGGLRGSRRRQHLRARERAAKLGARRGHARRSGRREGVRVLLRWHAPKVPAARAAHTRFVSPRRRAMLGP